MDEPRCTYLGNLLDDCYHLLPFIEDWEPLFLEIQPPFGNGNRLKWRKTKNAHKTLPNNEGADSESEIELVF